MSRRVCIVTAGHLSTCPRMVKAADALAARGYRVRVVSTRHTGWAAAADLDLRRSREGRWTWTIVDYRRQGARWRHAVTGARHRASRAYSRAHVELVRAALEAPPDLAPRSGGGLRLYWFSQTIGPGRGLEDAVRAMGRAALSGELHVRGAARAAHLDDLRRLAAEVAPGLRIVEHPPASPDAMVALCAPFDVGLSLERADIPHRDVCLTNKVFTYLLAGLPVALTATSAQGPLAGELDEGARLDAPGDVDTLAKGLRRWAEDRALLGRARQASRAAARRRWHWEHAEDRGALLAAAARARGVDDDAHRDHG